MTRIFVDTLVNTATGSGLIHNSNIDFSAQRAINKIILIVAAPKSGSTLLANTMAKSYRLALLQVEFRLFD